MEATATLARATETASTSSSPACSNHIYWKRCFICQSIKRPAKKFPLSQASAEGIVRVVECAGIREKCNDLSFQGTIDRLKNVNLSECEKQILWHRSCYGNFTNKEHIQRLQRRATAKQAQDNEVNEAQLDQDQHQPSVRRSLVDRMDWSKCMFCQENVKGLKLNQVQTFETSQKILEKAALDPVMSYRLAGTNDLIADEGKYHLKCYAKFQRTAVEQQPKRQEKENCFIFEEVMCVLQSGISKGNVYSLKSVWTYFCKRYHSAYGVDPETFKSDRFKTKIKNYLGDKVVFIQPLNPSESLLIISADLGDATLQSLLQKSQENNTSYEQGSLGSDGLEDVDLDTELLSWLFRVAMKVRNDIKISPGQESIGTIDMQSAEEVVPDTLYMLIRMLCAGEVDTTDDGNEELNIDLKRKILSICQDIVFLVSRGRKYTPKHVGIGVTVHQATRSKELVQLLHAAGHSISYETVLRLDNAIANDTLQRYNTNGNVIVPRNFTETSRSTYTRYAIDNIDINEETLSGMGTFHATQSAAFRRMNEEERKGHLNINLTGSRILNAPSDLHQLEPVNMVNEKPEPVFPIVTKESWYKPDRRLIDDAFKKDLAWILTRMAQQRPEVQTIPGWTGFNQALSKSDEKPTVVGPLPIVNAPAHEFETLWTVILKCQAMTHLRHGLYSVITLDEALYCKAKMIQWSKSAECKNLVIMLGGFHAQMTFSKVIGKYMESSGLSDIWEESGVFGETTADNILKGKIWNRVIRAHKLSFEALWRVLWPLFETWCDENSKDAKCYSQRPAKRLAEEFFSEDDESKQLAYNLILENLTNIREIFEEFDAEHKDDATFCFWRTYMQLVSILLRFTRAIREGNWDLFLSSFSEMLPWFAAFDHVNYFRWGTVFLTDMKMLQQTAPEVYQGFQEGDFVTKETANQFNQIPDDQALEHVNRTGKVAGGLVGITRSDAARDRWCITYNERAQLSEDTKAMFNVTRADGSDHKDIGRNRIKRDEEDVVKLVAQFERYDVFRQTTDLVAVTTGDVASDDIRNDLLQAQERGEAAVKTFVQERLIKKETKLHDNIKQQKLKTFGTLYSVNVKVNKDKTVSVRADRDLFRRVVVALESGREVDVDALLERELSSVPLSIATVDGKLRNCTSKADLSHILQKNTTQSRPEDANDTCTIIDGMASVQALGNRGKSATFGEWCDKFQSYVLSHFSDKCTRVDIVFDRYLDNSIKGGTRTKRKGVKGKGIRRKVESRDQKIGNWDRFVTLDENKASLAHFLCTKLSENCKLLPGQELVVSGGFNDPKKTWSSIDRDVSGLESDQEEADTRIVLHARDATLRGSQQINVLSRDTDVFLLLTAHKPWLCDVLWMFSGTARKKCYVPIHQIHVTEEIRESLLAFHALTGCDTTSQFSGIGKKSAWTVFVKHHDLLKYLGEESIANDKVLSNAETFVCHLYNPNTDNVLINHERVASFRRATKSLDSLPPTQNALFLHIRRAHFQTFIWKKALEPCPVLPSPEDNGWNTNDGILKPTLLTEEPVSASCIQLAYCGCSTERACGTRRCTCVRLSLKCSKACNCGDNCMNTILEE